MRAFAERGYDLIIGVGFAQTPIIELVAKDYPNIRFAIVDGVSNLPNVASMIFKEHEGSYLVGILAAKTTKTGTIGFLGGMDIGLIHRSKRLLRMRSRRKSHHPLKRLLGVTDRLEQSAQARNALAQIAKARRDLHCGRESAWALLTPRAARKAKCTGHHMRIGGF